MTSDSGSNFYFLADGTPVCIKKENNAIPFKEGMNLLSQAITNKVQLEAKGGLKGNNPDIRVSPSTLSLISWPSVYYAEKKTVTITPVASNSGSLSTFGVYNPDCLDVSFNGSRVEVTPVSRCLPEDSSEVFFVYLCCKETFSDSEGNTQYRIASTRLRVYVDYYIEHEYESEPE